MRLQTLLIIIQLIAIVVVLALICTQQKKYQKLKHISKNSTKPNTPNHTTIVKFEIPPGFKMDSSGFSYHRTYNFGKISDENLKEFDRLYGKDGLGWRFPK